MIDFDDMNIGISLILATFIFISNLNGVLFELSMKTILYFVVCTIS